MELMPILSAMRHRKTGVLLIALQVALTLAILANALYVVNDRITESQRPTGLDDARVFHVSVVDKQRDTTGAVTQADLDALRAIPGVVGASWVNQVPLSNSGNNSGYDLQPNAEDSLTTAATYIADPDIVATWGLRLVEGRAFRPDETQLVDENATEAPPVKTALITAAMAKALYPNESSVVGKPFYWGATGPIEVVGVVETLVSPWGRASWGGDGTRSVIFPTRLVQNWRTYAVRIDDPAAIQRLSAEAEELLQKRVPGRMSGGGGTMAETRERRYEGEHTMINGLLIVMGLLLVMTASGIVGLASLWVSQRRKQIGVRRAMGARRVDIVRYFLVENLLITSAGVVAGIGFALLLNDLLVRELQLARLPPGYLFGTMLAMWLLGLLAVLAPALRASLVPPAVATRTA